MKQKISLVVITLILILPITFYALFKAPSMSGALVAAEGKPIVLEFSSPMCSECIKLDKVLQTVEPKYENKISFQKINAALMDDAAKEKVQKYDVKVVPTTIFIDEKGQTIAKKEGYMTKNVMVSHLEELLK